MSEVFEHNIREMTITYSKSSIVVYGAVGKTYENNNSALTPGMLLS
jgi:hypothetical protein